MRQETLRLPILSHEQYILDRSVAPVSDASCTKLGIYDPKGIFVCEPTKKLISRLSVSIGYSVNEHRAIFSNIVIDVRQDSARYRKVIFVILWTMSALYISAFYDRGWIPHDEGALAQSAERLLAGELPHRDFDEIYTGGLTLVHAIAFKILGPSLISLRAVLFLLFLAFVPACYAIAIKFTRSDIAAITTFLAVVWSVPNYFASVPSWYNLVFSLFGILSVLRFSETQHARWLFVAGLFGGLSVLIKLVGLFYLVAIILFLVFKEQSMSNYDGQNQRIESRQFRRLTVVGLGMFLAALVLLLRWRLRFMEFFHFLLPQLAICSLLLRNEWQNGRGYFSKRIKGLCHLLLPFILGAMAPISGFMAFYLANGSVGDLVHGLFILPQKRLLSATTDFPPEITILAGAPYAMMILIPFAHIRGHLGQLFVLVMLCLLVAVLQFSGIGIIYSTVWQSIRSLGVVVVIAGCYVLVSRPLSKNEREKLFLLLTVTGLAGLVQYPFAAPIYFLYIAPLVCLSLTAVVAVQTDIPKLRHLIVLAFYMCFAVKTNQVNVWTLGFTYDPPKRVAPFMNSRVGGLIVTDDDIKVYAELLDLVKTYSRSAYIYAAPDCPEVYFLSGKRNPTRKIFDFFSDNENDPVFLSKLLKEQKINLAVINRKPHFSDALDKKWHVLLEQSFSRSKDVGHFTVRWVE